MLAGQKKLAGEVYLPHISLRVCLDIQHGRQEGSIQDALFALSSRVPPRRDIAHLDSFAPLLNKAASIRRPLLEFEMVVVVMATLRIAPLSLRKGIPPLLIFAD